MFVKSSLRAFTTAHEASATDTCVLILWAIYAQSLEKEEVVETVVEGRASAAETESH